MGRLTIQSSASMSLAPAQQASRRSPVAAPSVLDTLPELPAGASPFLAADLAPIGLVK